MKLLQNSFLILCFVFCAIGVLFIIFRVRTVTSNTTISKNVLNTFLDTNLVFTNYSQIITDISSTYPSIASIDIEKKYPSQIALTIETAQGLLAIYDREKYIIVSKTGIIIRISNTSEGLKTLTYFRELPNFSRKMGKMIPFEDISYVLKLQTEYIDKKYAQVRNFVITAPTTIELHFAEKPAYIISTQKSVAKNAFLVHNIQQVIREKSIQAAVVDVRYDLPVIKK